ncbi:MAG: 23S rRNA (cytidine1920-2'-O)/16S rRNA (cytidine1409-2'-O)-methyltransferase, partial [Luteibaculaceae bacterium]
TGGFTEVLLEHDIEKVLSIDTGTDLLHSKLLSNAKVTNLDNCDFRKLTTSDLPFQPNVVVCDVSLISLTEIIKVCRTMLRGEYHFFGLIKPQFEMTEKFRVKNGIVKTDKWRIQAINKITLTAKELGFQQHGEVSTVAGDGVTTNLEYGIHLSIGETLN